MLITALDHFLPDMGVKSEEKDCIFSVSYECTVHVWNLLFIPFVFVL